MGAPRQVVWVCSFSVLFLEFLFLASSARTLSRLFAAETHVSIKSWCQRARVAAAIARWSSDPHLPVKQAAADLGYASVPAFCHAFRQVTGRTPTAFVEGR